MELIAALAQGIDWRFLLMGNQGNPEQVRANAIDFCHEIDSHTIAAEQALQAKDFVGLSFNAHRLAGLMSLLVTDDTAKTLYDLEIASRAGQMQTAQDLFAVLNRQIKNIKETITDIDTIKKFINR